MFIYLSICLTVPFSCNFLGWIEPAFLRGPSPASRGALKRGGVPNWTGPPPCPYFRVDRFRPRVEPLKRGGVLNKTQPHPTPQFPPKVLFLLIFLADKSCNLSKIESVLLSASVKRLFFVSRMGDF